MPEPHFTDPDLNEYFRKTAKIVPHGFTDGQAVVLRLFIALDWFRRQDGEVPVTDDAWPTTARVREIVGVLTDPETRPELRRWYEPHGANMTDAARELRDRLALMTGEGL